MTSIDLKSIHEIQIQVLDWYKENGRHDLPWRNFDSNQNQLAYHVLVSEFMLQQTQVERVIPKYQAFLRRFPTMLDLASAQAADVITLWSGLGYNRRAVMLYNTASAIAREYSGIIPSDSGLLAKLPGIGPYTLAAILAFGFNQPVVVLDTNIIRFYELLVFGYDKPSVKQVTGLAVQFVPINESRQWHSALMDLMSEIRKIRSPKSEQEALLKAITMLSLPTLPKLTDIPLERPKQSPFRDSKRYYRGRIIAYLTQCPANRASLKAIQLLLKSERMPENYEILELLQSLKKDSLIMLSEPLSPESEITLS